MLTGPVDARVREQIVAETRGNPLALLELPRGLTAAELAGGFGLPGALPLPGRIEDSFRRRVDALPARDPAAAAAGGGRSDRRSGAGVAGRRAARDRHRRRRGRRRRRAWPSSARRVRFRHPLVRSAVYRSASAQERQEVHRALAEATDPQADPDRRAWHRAQAAAGPG